MLEFPVPAISAILTDRDIEGRSIRAHAERARADDDVLTPGAVGEAGIPTQKDVVGSRSGTLQRADDAC